MSGYPYQERSGGWLGKYRRSICSSGSFLLTRGHLPCCCPSSSSAHPSAWPKSLRYCGSCYVRHWPSPPRAFALSTRPRSTHAALRCLVAASACQLSASSTPSLVSALTQVFAFTSTLEAAVAVAFNATPVPLSEQWTLQCASDYPCDDQNLEDKNCSQSDPATAKVGFCEGGNGEVVARNVQHRFESFVLPESAFDMYTAGIPGAGIVPLCPPASWFTATFGPRGVAGVPGSAGFYASIGEARAVVVPGSAAAARHAQRNAKCSDDCSPVVKR